MPSLFLIKIIGIGTSLIVASFGRGIDSLSSYRKQQQYKVSAVETDVNTWVERLYLSLSESSDGSREFCIE
jgi:hypothetical protein